MGSCWGTSPFAAYAAHLAERHNITYMTPPPIMTTSNVAVVGVPNTSFQVPQPMYPQAIPTTSMTQMTQMAPQPVYMSRPGTPIHQYW